MVACQQQNACSWGYCFCPAVLLYSSLFLLFVFYPSIIIGGLVGLLDGIPYAAKDNFCTLGVQTTASSAALAGFTPPYDSTPTGRLRQAGSPLIGKTNMDEFGMGSGTLFSEYGRTLNPWSPGTCQITSYCLAYPRTLVFLLMCLLVTPYQPPSSWRIQLGIDFNLLHIIQK